MKYLLDVNVLLALLATGHTHHQRASAWAASLAKADSFLLTPLVELGFLRVGLNTKHVPDLASGQQMLSAFASGQRKVALVSDNSPARDLPAWVATPAGIMDGHLLALATRHRAQLATMDAGIPGAVLIP